MEMPHDQGGRRQQEEQRLQGRRPPPQGRRPPPQGRRPSPRGEPLPATSWVIRLLRISKDGKVETTEFDFVLSSKDKQTDPPLLSVWEETLTPPKQALAIVNTTGEVYGGYCRLSVEAVRQIRCVELPEHRLEVVWDPLEPMPPGGEGHAGVSGLERPTGVPKSAFKTLRVQLADMASRQLYRFS
jgi:hypothetical protein